MQVKYWLVCRQACQIVENTVKKKSETRAGYSLVDDEVPLWTCIWMDFRN